jgi:hypothetical protein
MVARGSGYWITEKKGESKLTSAYISLDRIKIYRTLEDPGKCSFYEWQCGEVKIGVL